MNIDVMKQARDALREVCGGRCNAEYNPCWHYEIADRLDYFIEQAAQKENLYDLAEKADNGGQP